jgi:hypothetical protein
MAALDPAMHARAKKDIVACRGMTARYDAPAQSRLGHRNVDR